MHRLPTYLFISIDLDYLLKLLVLILFIFFDEYLTVVEFEIKSGIKSQKPYNKNTTQ